MKLIRKFVYFFSRNARRLKRIEEEIEEINKAILKVYKELNDENRRNN